MSASEEVLLIAHAADRELAAACLAGQREALLRFEREQLGPIAAWLSRRRIAPSDIDEVMQQLREKLLTGERPRLVDYAGRGALQAWLRAAALRTAHNLRRTPAARAKELSADLLAATDSAGAAELLALESRHAPALKHAVQAGLATLPPRERTVLRLHLLDGLSLDEIGRLYHVNKSSVSRWLTTARAQVLDVMKQELAAEIDAGELGSLVRVLRQRIDLSLTRVLRTTP